MQEGMDNQYAFATKDDIWRFHGDLKSIYAVQNEHADRLLRLERRLEDDGRTKSVWGSSSFHSVRGGTPHQDPQYNPAAEAFKNFDQDNSTNLLGSLHLDSEEEPRRGASRANSVRFDESALHGQLTHTSRSSSEFFPLRTGSAIGSHPLTERSSSHKSEGRQSSAGLSTHSAGLSGLNYDQQNQNMHTELDVRPAPGILLLGPHPSIIRCWLGSRFSNDTLRYVVINSGATHSAIARSWLNELGLSDQIYHDSEQTRVKLQISFPEATIQQSGLGSASPTTQLPSILAQLLVFDDLLDVGAIQCFLGSDILRTRNADILFSKDRLTLYDDSQGKLSIPLIRPEHATTYEHLKTINTSRNVTWRDHSERQLEPKTEAETLDDPTIVGPLHRAKSTYSRLDWSRVRQGKGESPAQSGQASPHLRDSDSDQMANLKKEQLRTFPSKPTEVDLAVSNTQSHTFGSSERGDSWPGWRKEPATMDQPKEPTFSSIASSASQRSTSQGKGMKILKARRMSSNRSAPNADNVLSEASPSMWGSVSQNDAGVVSGDGPRSRRSYSSDLKSAFTSSGGTLRPSNPVGGASAFGWLTPSQSRS